MLRSSVYVIGGVVAGVALTENKEAVGDFLFSAGTFLQSFATEVRNVQVSGTKLGEVPGLGQTLDYLSNMELKRDSLQLGVNQARTALTDVVRRTDTSSSKSTAVAPNTSSSGSSLPGYLSLGLLVAVPTSIYLYVDANAREQAQKLTQQAMEKVKEGVQHLETAAKDEAYRKRILDRISQDVKEAGATAEKYYNQGKHAAQEQLLALIRLIQEQLHKAGFKPKEQKESFQLFDSK